MSNEEDPSRRRLRVLVADGGGRAAEAARTPEHQQREGNSSSDTTNGVSSSCKKKIMAGWRLDPAESFSDLTIVVRGARFHVHRYVLVHAGVPCDYFRGFLRKGGQFDRKPEIDLSESLDDTAALALPVFLDYLYETTLPEFLPAAEMVALMHLGDYFGVSALVKEIEPGVEMLLEDPRGLCDCLPAIIEYQKVPAMKGAYTLAVHYSALAILLSEDTDHLKRLTQNCGMDLPFLKETLKLCNDIGLAFNQVKPTRVVSPSRAAAYFLESRLHESRSDSNLRPEDLEEITSEKFMSQVAPEVALLLLEVEYETVSQEPAPITSSNAGQDELTSLQVRCIDALIRQRKTDGNIINGNEARRVLKKLPRYLLVNLLVPAITNQPIAPTEQQPQRQPHSIKIRSHHADLHVGEYCRTEDYGGASFYRNLEGTWLKEPATFQLIRTDEKDWALVLEVSEDNGVILYRNEKKSSLPPPCEWRCESPRVKYPIFLLYQCCNI